MAGKASLKRAEDFVDFLNASPSGMSLIYPSPNCGKSLTDHAAFHAVHSAKLRLEKAGFKAIKVV